MNFLFQKIHRKYLKTSLLTLAGKDAILLSIYISVRMAGESEAKNELFFKLFQILKFDAKRLFAFKLHFAHPFLEKLKSITNKAFSLLEISLLFRLL